MNEAAEISAAALVVGGGISGMSAAAAFADAAPDRAVVVIDRGRRLGGRVSARTLRSGPWAGHVVDLGAAYLTVGDPGFTAVVDDWLVRGLCREWTDTFAVAGPGGITGTTTGPMRYTAAQGLRALVEDLAAALPPTVSIRNPVEAMWVASSDERWYVNTVTTSATTRPFGAHVVRADAVALCMPTPQAAELLGTPLDDDDASGMALLASPAAQDLHALTATATYHPILTFVAQWPRRCWDRFGGCFVNDDEVLSFVADDGDRRGDDAAVLVAHSTVPFATAHQWDPAGAADAMAASVCRVLGLPAPAAHEVKRWGQAKPAQPPAVDTPADADYLAVPDARIGVATDAFDARPRIEAAWRSGRHLGITLSSGLGTA